MIKWTKIDNSTDEAKDMDRVDIFYNIIKEIPFMVFNQQAGSTSFILQATRLPGDTNYDHLKIYVDGVYRENINYTNLETGAEYGEYDGFTLLNDYRDHIVYVEYLPKNPGLLFNEITPDDLGNTTRMCYIERKSIQLQHEIINELVLHIKNFESHLFKNDYNFNSFLIYHNRSSDDEISKMHISEAVSNLTKLRIIMDTTDEIDTTRPTYDPITLQTDADDPMLYDIIHEKLIKSIREQLNMIENVASINI